MTAGSGQGARPPVRTFGRTGGRPLSPRQTRLLETQLGKFAIPDGDHVIDPHDLFPGVREIWFEIGFGGAEHLCAQATRHSGTALIGAEPFVEGIAKALVAISEGGLTNVRLWPDDARLLMARLPPGSLTRVFILFPDPWPKRRQQKRRLIQPDFVANLYSLLAPGARVRFATDVRSYADEALLAFLAHGGFAWDPQTAHDWRLPPADHFTTRYETKGLGDCAPVWFEFAQTAGIAAA